MQLAHLLIGGFSPRESHGNHLVLGITDQAVIVPISGMLQGATFSNSIPQFLVPSSIGKYTNAASPEMGDPRARWNPGWFISWTIPVYKWMISGYPYDLGNHQISFITRIYLHGIHLTNDGSCQPPIYQHPSPNLWMRYPQNSHIYICIHIIIYNMIRTP